MCELFTVTQVSYVRHLTYSRSFARDQSCITLNKTMNKTCCLQCFRDLATEYCSYRQNIPFSVISVALGFRAKVKGLQQLTSLSNCLSSGWQNFSSITAYWSFHCICTPYMYINPCMCESIVSRFFQTEKYFLLSKKIIDVLHFSYGLFGWYQYM